MRLSENGPKLSFGRKMSAEAKLGNYEVKSFLDTEQWSFAVIEDGFKLSCGILDETKISAPVYPNHYHSDTVIENSDYIGKEIPDNLIQPVTFCRAMVLLSEANSVLGYHQCCFSGSYKKLNDELFKLSFHKLSMHANYSEAILIEVRKLSEITADAKYDGKLTAERAFSENFSVFLAELAPKIDASTESELFAEATYKGNSTWSDNVHFDIPWNEQNWYGKMTEDEWRL